MIFVTISPFLIVVVNMKGSSMMYGKKNIRAVGVIFLQFSMVLASQEVSFETIATLRLRSFGLELKAPGEEQKKLDPKDFQNPKFIKEALSVNLSDDEKRRLVYQICVQHEQRLGCDKRKESESLKTLLEDLDVFYGRGENAQETIYNHLFDGRVVTLFGEAMAAKRLARIEVDSAQLTEYQQVVNKLAQEDSLFMQLDSCLHQLKEAETNMVSFWKDEHPLVKDLIKQLYFGRFFPERFNKHATKLELLTRISNCSLAFGLGGEFVLNTAMMYGIKKFFNQPTSLGDAAKEALSMYNPKSGIDDIKFQSTQAGFQMRDALIKNNLASQARVMSKEELEKQHATYKRFFCVFGGIKSALSVFNIYAKISSIKMFIEGFKRRRDTANFLQERLIGVATYLHTLKHVYDLSLKHPELLKVLPISSVCQKLFGPGHDELHQLVGLLLTDTFKGQASFFSRTGRVLAAYSLMQNCKHELVEALELLGALDSCLATAKLYRQFAGNDRVTYSFAQFCESDQPIFKAIDFWNPLIDPSIVVTNSVHLGKQAQARNMILTGSNKGGKSTILKALMLSALLAQTITIVPAQKYTATPFAYLCTYMNVADDTAAGRSLFAAQVRGVKKLMKSVDDLDEHAFGLIVMDEVLIGTNVTKAAPAAYKLAKHLSESPRVCFVLATHFIEDLCKLEQDVPGLVQNYKVDADKTSDGKVIFRHKLEPGISSCNIANDILRDELQGIDFESCDSFDQN